MSKLEYETINYCEFAMIDAVREYGEELSKSALEIAKKYNVPVSVLHTEFAKYRAKVNRSNNHEIHV